MQHKSCFDAVNCSLNDICHVSDSCLFSRIPTVLGGDFAHVLPVVRRGSRQATVQACIHHSSISNNLPVLRLNTTIKIAANSTNQFFINFLKSLVCTPSQFGKIQLPQLIPKVSTIDELCQELYPHALLQEAVTSCSALNGRAILAFKNHTMNHFNNMLLDRIPDTEHRFEAVNTVQYSNDANEAVHYPVE